MLLTSLALAIAIKATETYVCKYDIDGEYLCTLIGESDIKTEDVTVTLPEPEWSDRRSTHKVHSK